MKHRIWVILLVVLFMIMGMFSSIYAADKGNNGIPQQIERIKEELAHMLDLFTGQQQELDIHQDKLDDLTVIVNQQNDRITELEERVDRQEQEINDLREQLAGIIEEDPDPEKKAYTVSGIMVDAEGNPFVSGLMLRSSTGQAYYYDELNPDGSFAFYDIPDGLYSFDYYFDEYQINSPQQVRVSGEDVTDVTITLDTPTYSISGNALSEDGTPLAGQEVSIKSGGNIGGYFWPPTGHDGSFTITGIAPGDYEIMIGEHDNPLATGEVSVTDQDVTGLVIQGNSLHQVSGVMEDVYGEPFYAPLMLEGDGQRYWSRQSGEGSFYFPPMPEGTYNLRFHSPSYELVRDSADEIVVNESIDNLTIKLSVPTYSVRGKALKSDGTPLQNVSVYLEDSYGAGWSTGILTGDDGSFVIPGLPDGTYKIEIGDHATPLASAEVIISGQDVTDVVIRE